MPDQTYAIYRTSATDGQPAGYIVNRIIWDGSAPLGLSAGLSTVADPTAQYPIGSTYTAPAS